MPNLALQVNYTYGRVDQSSDARRSSALTTADWQPVAPLVGHDCRTAVAYNIPLFIPDAAKVAADGGGRLLTNFDDYSTTFNGIELSVNKRMSNRWMMRLACRLQQPDGSTTT